MTVRARQVDIARAYDLGPPDGRCRVLVDRLWPRGLSKDELALDHWFKELAPSAELRKWFDHRPEGWVAFREKYVHELDSHSDLVAGLRKVLASGPTVLVFAARDVDHNNAVALRDYLARKRSPRKK
jgi:uncharacterized protein YeaO (DUF488 family)